MSLLRQEEEEGSLKGIPIGDSREQLPFQLFANDTSLFLDSTEDNFKVALDVIVVYERISGARLNLENSIILQLDKEVELAWFSGLGCRITQQDEILVYLGTMEVKLLALKEANFLLDQIRKQITHWNNHMLSMQGHLVLLRHVLWVVQIYHLMAMTLNKGGFDDLEKLCREFIWGLGD